jgi:hypothetical protein
VRRILPLRSVISIHKSRSALAPLLFPRASETFSMGDIVRCRTPAGATSSIMPP